MSLTGLSPERNLFYNRSIMARPKTAKKGRTVSKKADRAAKIRDYAGQTVKSLEEKLADTNIRREELELIAEALAGRRDRDAKKLRAALEAQMARVGSWVQDHPDPVSRER